MTGIPTAFGRDLCKEWKIDARGYFHKFGKWYQFPKSFPAALCDPKGYVYFKSEEDLNISPDVQIGVRIHVTGGISTLSIYKKMR